MQSNRPILPGFLVNTIFSYNNINSNELKNQGSPLSIDKIELYLKAKKLLEYVSAGNEEKTNSFLKAYPETLFQRVTTKDHVERTIEASAFQFAIGALDINMLKIMEQHIKSIHEGPKKALLQLNEQLPEEKHQTKSNSPNFAEILEKLKLDINNATKVAEDLEKYLKPKATIKKGFHTNFKLLLNAYQALGDDMGLIPIEVTTTYGSKVISLLQKNLSLYSFQAFQTGITKINSGEKLSRDNNSKDKKYFGFYCLEGIHSSEANTLRTSDYENYKLFYESQIDAVKQLKITLNSMQEHHKRPQYAKK